MKIGDKIQLKNQEVETVVCGRCGDLMVNIDASELAPGDLVTLKKAGVKISNPETKDPICLNDEVRTWGRRVADWFEENKEDDDDSSFFPTSTGSSSGGLFGGGGFGGFGGFGGGGFGGGGASRGF